MKTFDDNFEEACRNLFENAEFAPSNNLWNKIQGEMKSDNLWEKTVRQLFNNAEITPSERVWQRIANTLHRPVIAPLWRWASAAAVALVVGSGIYYFAENENLADSSNQQQNSQKKKAETPQDLSEKGNAFAEKSSIASISSNSEKENTDSYIENTNPVPETAKTVSAKQSFVPIPKSENLRANDNNNNRIVIAKANTQLIASPVGLTLLAFPTEFSQNLSIIKPVRLGLVVTPQEVISSETEIRANYKYWIGVNIGLQDFKNNFQIAENLQGNPFLLQNELSRTNMRSVLLDSVQVQNAYSLGFEFARKFGKIFVVSAGLQHQSSEYRANVLLRQYTPQALKPEQTYTDQLQVKQSSWGIPLLVGADWQNKNGLGLLFMAGLQANFANSSQVSNQFTLAQYDLGTYQKMNLAGLVRFGANYAITEHFNLGLESSYLQTLQNIYSSSHLEARPSRLGFSANLRYRF